MILRLDPALPVLWRTPASLQLGAPARVVLEEVDVATERVVAALVAGVSEPGLRLLARGLDVDALLARLAPALEPPPAPARRVAVTGAGAVAAEIARQLEDAGSRVATDDSPGLAILVADHVVAPEEHGRWLRRDVPHLPVVVGADAVEVGPLVVPGAGPCLYCVHLARCEEDPAWPALAVQLERLEPAALPRTVVAEAAALAARRAAEPPGPDAARSTRLGVASGALSERRWRIHPGCRCAAPPGSDWAREPDPAIPRAPS